MPTIHKRLIFLSLFTLVGFIGLQIPFSKLIGSNISFTLFDFFAPIAGVFLGPVLGIVSILTVELVNVFIKETPLNTIGIIRLFPLLFASFYFALTSRNQKYSKYVLVIPLFCILAFIAHPVGRSVWFYSLFWLIPVVAYFKRDVLLIRSLGSTFTAHAVGGAAWIWTLNLPASVWKGLIPVVISERLLFAVGIALSFLAVKHTLSFLISKKYLPKLDFVLK